MNYTPLIKIRYKLYGKEYNVFAKLEYFNLTGSIKDRIAHYIIEDLKRKKIAKDTPIVEATSGNTGIALAALCAKNKYPLHIFMPKTVSAERKELLKLYGAKVHYINKKNNSFIKCVKEAKKFAEDNNGIFTNQFANKANYLAHYENTANEIAQQISESISGFVSGVGTGGTIMGVGDKLKEIYPDVIITAIEPDAMPILSEGKNIKGHKIEGIGDDFVPDLIDKNKIDKIILINDDDAINMAKLLCEKLGLGVGISSGANFLGSVILHEEIAGNIVTIFADDNKKYLSTKFKNKKNKPLLSNDIDLIDYEFVLKKESLTKK